MPQPVFQKLNERLLIEKEEVRLAIEQAKKLKPEPVDYKNKIMRFTDALAVIEDPEISAKVKNQYFRDIIERVDYDRPPNVKITKKNAAKYGAQTGKGMRVHTEPFTLKITLK